MAKKSVCCSPGEVHLAAVSFFSTAGTSLSCAVATRAGHSMTESYLFVSSSAVLGSVAQAAVVSTVSLVEVASDRSRNVAPDSQLRDQT